MKESKAVYVTKRDIKVELNRDYQFYANNIIRDRDFSPEQVRYDQKTQEVGCQYDFKRDNLICTCRNLATLRKKQEVRYFGLPKQIYTYHGSRSYTDIGVGSVKALQRKKVRKIYLPETDDRGVGNSEQSSYFLRKTRQNRTSSYYENKRTSSKCVGGILEYNTGCVMNEKLSPIIQTTSGATSPRSSKLNRNIEIGSNSVVKSLTNTTTQVEDIGRRETEFKPEVKLEQVAPVILVKTEPKEVKIKPIEKEMKSKGIEKEIITKSIDKDVKSKSIEKEVKTKTIAKETKMKTIETHKSIESKVKSQASRVYSSDSLLQHVHNLEDPSFDKESHLSVDTEDPMENKLEREYRRIFAAKSKSRDSKSTSDRPGSDRPMSDFKSTSTLKRRFEALRRGLAKKDDSKKNSVIISRISSQMSAASRKDVSINSDPPSLEGRSFSNTKTYSPFAATFSRDQTIYNPRTSHYKRSVTDKKERGSAQWSSRADDDDSECQGVKGMFKLWGKKFNLEEDAYKRRPTPKPSFSSSRKSPTKKIEEPLEIKPEIEEKKEGRKFFFFKKKNKDNKEKSYKGKKGVTAGRCEVRDGLIIKIGGVPTEEEKEPEIIPDDYDDVIKKAWLNKFLSHAIESRNSVQVRWNNKTYGPSSSTVFELMDNVYKDTGVIFKSKSEVEVHSSYKSYTKQQVNFMNQNIEAWMIPKTVTNRPKPVRFKCKSDDERKNNIEVRISDQKWFIDKSKAFSHKIEVVLHSKNFSKINKEASSEYLRIDIPKGFFVESSSDDTNKHHGNQSSDEEVYKIVEYETESDLKKEKTLRSFDIGDHKQNNIKVTVSVKESKDCNSKVLENLTKPPPTNRHVVIQGSDVFIPKRCDVVGVGIITQRDLREVRKPILKIQDDYSDEESEHNILRPNQKKCDFAESYLQEYYRHWTPLGIDLYSWCVSDSHLRCCSENSRASFNNQGDGSKSCPNIFDDFQASTIVSSCGASSCSQCHNYDDANKSTDKCSWFGKLRKKSKDKESNKKSAPRRISPKDSIEVFKRRKIYAASAKSKWAGPCTDFDPPYSAVPSNDTYTPNNNTLTSCPKLKKSCCKPVEPKPRRRHCKKHVSLPDCDTMNNLLAKQLTDAAPEGILAHKSGTGCDVCKKKGVGYCPKHTTINPDRSCEMPNNSSKASCDSPPCPGSQTSKNPSGPPTPKKSSGPGSPQSGKKPKSCSPSCPASPCPPSSPRKKASPCPPAPPPSCKIPSPRHSRSSTRCPTPPCNKTSPTNSKKSSRPPTPTHRKQWSRPPTPPCKKSPSCPPSPPPCCPTHPSCPHIRMATCPPSPLVASPIPSPPSPPPCPLAPPSCPHSAPCATPPCQPAAQAGSHPSTPKCYYSPKPCPLAPPTCPLTPQSCCSADPSRCPAEPPPCKKTSSNISKKLSLSLRGKSSVQPTCPASPPCNPKPCSESSCKTLSCQSPREKTSCEKTPSPCKKFSKTSCSYGSLHQAPEAPYFYSPIHPCPPEPEPKPKKPKKIPLPCKSSPCNKLDPKNPPQFDCQESLVKKPTSDPSCDQCRPKKDDEDFPWPTKNQCSNNSSVTSLCKPRYELNTESIEYGKCKKDCPMLPKMSCETIPSPKKEKKECRPSCPNRYGELRPSCIPDMQCPPPKPPPPPPPPPCPPKPVTPLKCRSKPKVSGLYLKMKPVAKKKSTCSKDCLAWDSSRREDGCISLNSEEKITIRLKKETPSTEEIREGLNIKVQDEDGLTLFERKDYRMQAAHTGCGMQKSSLLGDMYKASEVHRLDTDNSVQAMGCKDEREDIIESKSEASIANLIEIQFKLKVTQGEKTTEINIANDGDKDNETEKIETKDQTDKAPQEVFIVKDAPERAKVEHTDAKNDINIRIVIKNFKPKSGKKKSIADHDDYSNEFSKKISAKFHTVSTGYSDVLHDDNVFSIHRATVDLTSSVDKSKTASNKSEEMMSEPLQADKGILIGFSEQSICRCITDVSETKSEGFIEVKSIASQKYSATKDIQENQEETDTEKLTDHKYEYTEETDTDKPIKYDTEETDTDKQVEPKYDTEETDTEKRIEQKYDTFLSTDTDEPDMVPEIKKSNSIEVIVKPHTKDEKKEMLKHVLEKAHETKSKNKNRMRKLRDMLKVILTSDSSDHDDSKVQNNDLAKDVTFASLKPNYFRDSDSMNNYYRAESNTMISEGEINTQVMYPTIENNSECSNNSNQSDMLSSDNESPKQGGCMCSTVAARLKLASRIGDGGGCCCGTKKITKKNEETTCDLKKDSDYFGSDYKTTEYVNVETQNSRNLTSKINSTDLSLPRSMKSSIMGSVDMEHAMKEHSGVINVNDKNFNPRKSFSPHMNHVKECEMRKLNRNTILSISDEDKIVLLSGKPTRVSCQEPSEIKERETKRRSKEPINVYHAADILQSYETKKAVLEIYTEKTVSDEGERLVAKLPKFVYDREHEIQTNYEAMATNTYKAVCKRNIVMMAINR